jgi:hypothetical protein
MSDAHSLQETRAGIENLQETGVAIEAVVVVSSLLDTIP